MCVEEFAQTAGFMLLGEEALSILLYDDGLVARSEEAVWDSVIRWNGVSAVKGVAWRGVVGKIRYSLMGEEYLGNRVVGMVGGKDGEWMAGVVAEALRAKEARREGAVLELSCWGGRLWWIWWG
jgi:hypothetical protein